MRCSKCRSEKSIKSGKHLGRQRYKCKECGYQFTLDRPRGKDLQVKCLAVILYVNGLSFRKIAQIIKVSHKTVYDWVKSLGLETYEKLKSEVSVVIELDEMRCFLTAKKTSFGHGAHFVVLQVNSSTGDMEAVAVIP